VCRCFQKPLQINVYDPFIAFRHVLPGGINRLMGAPAWPKPEAMLRELGVEYQREYLRYGLLDQPVQRRGHSQLSLAAVGLGDRHPANRCGSVVSFLEQHPDARPASSEPRPQVGDRHPVHAWSALVLLDSLQRPHQVPLGEHVLPQPLDSGGLGPPTGWRRAAAAFWQGFRGTHRFPTSCQTRACGLATLCAIASSLAGVPPTWCSALHGTVIPAATMASADFCWVHRVVTAAAVDGLRRRHPSRPPRVKTAAFPLPPPRLRADPLVVTGFAVWRQLTQIVPPPTR
jgi:hypothetical protein